MAKIILDALRDLEPFAQFKKREKYPWKSVAFSKVPGFSMSETKKLILICSRFDFYSLTLSEIYPVFLTFLKKIVHLVPNRATQHIFT